MEVLILPHHDATAVRAADIVEVQLRQKPSCTLGLATGSTPIALYNELIRRHRSNGLSFSQATSFNLDEYIGLDPTHPQSYRRFMNDKLFDHIDIPITATHVPNGLAENPLEEGPAYEAKIREAGGIDLQILGIGSDGHIGFNEPTSSLGSRTRIKTLTEQTITDNSRFFEAGEAQPHLAITMGIKTIMESKRILLLATGEGKAEAIAATVEGAITAMCPASILQWHEKTTILIDEAAASKLQKRDYYQWVSTQQDALVRKYRPSDLPEGL